MYNENIKKEYLTSDLVTENVRKTLNLLFSKSKIYEERKNKDICNFTENEILEFISGLSSISLNTITGYVSLLRRYTQWCCDNNINLDNINHYDMVTRQMLEPCVNKFNENNKYISKEQLEKLAENLINVCDKAILWALFYGISCDELSAITKNDIELYEGEIKLNTGRTIFIPFDACGLIYQSCDIYDYFSGNPNTNRDTFMLDPNDPTPFKRRVNAKVPTPKNYKLRLSARLNKIREDTGSIALTLDRLKSSGMIYFIRGALELNPELDKQNVFNSDEMRLIKKRYSCEHVQGFTLAAKYKNFI